jgi:hypothetical protein
MTRAGLVVAAGWMVVACRGDASLDVDALMDPKTCEECHPVHYEQWRGSMHAYASEDPVFVAMNQRGQRETAGALGDFCIQCHAPMAVALGETTDGLNVAELPDHLRGVTCYYCHNVAAVEGTHNNPITLAMDAVMRAGIGDPVGSDAHDADASSFVTGKQLDSARMCGSCHDIVNPAGVHLERTYAEWLASFYADPSERDPAEVEVYGQTCNFCHMPGSDGPIADAPGVRADRRLHEHSWPGVDIALTDFAGADEQRAAIEDFRRTSLCASLCVGPGAGAGQTEVSVWLHNEGAGHGWPSGANQDRRAWVEVVASEAGQVVYQSGVVADDQPIANLDDPDLWLFRDVMTGEGGREVHMFWEARDVTGTQLPAAADVTGDATTWIERTYTVSAGAVDEVRVRVRLRPMGLDVLDDLVVSGDLDAAVRSRIETFDVAPSMLTWTPMQAAPSESHGSCVSTSNGCFSPFI